MALPSPALLGQPQLAPPPSHAPLPSPQTPQFLLAGHQPGVGAGVIGAGIGAGVIGASIGAGVGGVQQILIPVSGANGTQQLLSIPLSMAAGLGGGVMLATGGPGGQIQLLTTAKGQIIAASLAGLAAAATTPPMGVPMATNTGERRPALVGPTLVSGGPPAVVWP